MSRYSVLRSARLFMSAARLCVCAMPRYTRRAIFERYARGGAGSNGACAMRDARSALCPPRRCFFFHIFDYARLIQITMFRRLMPTRRSPLITPPLITSLIASPSSPSILPPLPLPFSDYLLQMIPLFSLRRHYFSGAFSSALAATSCLLRSLLFAISWRRHDVFAVDFRRLRSLRRRYAALLLMLHALMSFSLLPLMLRHGATHTRYVYTV